MCVCSMNFVILFKADYCAGTCFFSHTLLFSLCCRSRLCWRLGGQFLRVPAEGLAHVRQNWRGGKEALLRCPAGKVHCYREKKPREMLLYWPFDQMTRQLLTRQASLTSLFLEETCKLKWLVSKIMRIQTTSVSNRNSVPWLELIPELSQIVNLRIGSLAVHECEF